MNPLTIVKAIGGPGSIGFLGVGSLLGLALIRLAPRGRVIGRAWLFTLYVTYVILALPAVAHLIAAPFAEHITRRQAVDASIDTLVVFDGDNRRGRLRESLRLWTAAHPTTVIVSGERWLQVRLFQSGIPRDRIVRERDSLTTRDQVEYVAEYVKSHPEKRVAVVASRLQVPRVSALFQRARVPVSVYGSPIDEELTAEGVRRYIPAYAALRISRDAFYERAALAYYAWQGWIGPADGDE